MRVDHTDLLTRIQSEKVDTIKAKTIGGKGLEKKGEERLEGG